MLIVQEIKLYWIALGKQDDQTKIFDIDLYTFGFWCGHDARIFAVTRSAIDVYASPLHVMRLPSTVTYVCLGSVSVSPQLKTILE